MANWNKLNNELDEVLESMTPEDWQEWYAKKQALKVAREAEYLLKSRICSARLTVQQLELGVTSDFTIVPKVLGLNNANFKITSLVVSEDSFAMAA